MNQPIDYDERKEWDDLRVHAEELYPYPPKKRWWEKRDKPMGLYFWLAVITLAFFGGWLVG